MRTVAAALLLGGCMTTAGGEVSEERYRALGTEPFWAVTIAEGRMVYERAGETGFTVAAPVARPTFNGRRYETPRLTVDVTRTPCSDGMSDRTYPETVMVMVDGETLRGCGGAPLAPSELAGTNWRIESIGGVPVVSGERGANLAFEAARLTGSSGCNRFFGGYARSGDMLTLEAIGATRMACPGPLMDQENRLFAILKGRIGMSFRDGDTLVLTGSGGQAVVLKRAI